MEVHVYRPGPFLAAGILALPVIGALAGAVIGLAYNAAIPVWLPFVLLLWMPFLMLAWRAMLSVRTNGISIAAGRPWTRWSDIPWSLVERVEQSRGRIRVHGSNGIRIMFTPVLLRNGGRLKRQMLLRLPAHVLSPQLAREAQILFASGTFTMGGSGLSGTLYTRSRRRWRLAVSGAVVVLLGAATGSVVGLPRLVGVPLAVFFFALAAGGMSLLVWLFQEILVSEKGITAISSFTHRARGMTWEQVQMVEHSAGQAVLRLRGAHRIVCIGPALLAPAERDLMRAFLFEYCVYRSIPVLRRPWLF